MKTLHFAVDIDAPKEKVWEKLWSDSGYREWTSAFMEGSYAESDWQQGSRILFLSPSGSGMYAVIDEMVPLEKMSFKHLGEIHNGVEKSTFDEEAFERYQLSGNNGTTTVQVDVDTVEDFEKYFAETFPKALDILKRICERP